ncbi:C2H2 type zinc-finger-domain-containing protein [Chytridium lagenaria]|nr:C2H2 type zinc-finger-domain-containing protein [Chytridium lagenaria]
MHRGVAELPPVTQEAFVHRVKAQQAINDAETERSSLQLVCVPLWSKGDTIPESTPLTEADPSTSPPNPTIPWRIQLAAAKTDAEFDAILLKKASTSPRLALTDCLFCTHRSASLEDSMSHMAVSHSFFIPDLEFLIDLEGLITYLGEKISVGNLCIYCNGKGRAMHSLEAVRDHMVMKGHCKVAYEDGDDEELVDFYDFGMTWEDEEVGKEEVDNMEEDIGEDWVELDEQEAYVAERTKGLTLSEDESRLTLASGRTLITDPTPAQLLPSPSQYGCRPHSVDHVQLYLHCPLAGRYASLGAVPIHTRMAVKVLERQAKKQNCELSRTYTDFKLKTGMINNYGNLRKHFVKKDG